MRQAFILSIDTTENIALYSPFIEKDYLQIRIFEKGEELHSIAFKLFF